MPRYDAYRIDGNIFTSVVPPPPSTFFAHNVLRTNLVAVGLDDVSGRIESTATLRTRWRSDVVVGTILEGPRGIRWIVTETSDVEGGIRWLDMAVTSYQFVDGAQPADDPDWTAPTGYTLAVSGVGVQSLRVIYVPTRAQGGGEVFYFENPPGAVGAIPSGLRVRLPPGNEPGTLTGSAVVQAGDRLIPRTVMRIRGELNGFSFTLLPTPAGQIPPSGRYNPAVGDWFRVESG